MVKLIMDVCNTHTYYMKYAYTLYEMYIHTYLFSLEHLAEDDMECIQLGSGPQSDAEFGPASQLFPTQQSRSINPSKR